MNIQMQSYVPPNFPSLLLSILIINDSYFPQHMKLVLEFMFPLI